jgi:SAM-dependent methyltransferase
MRSYEQLLGAEGRRVFFRAERFRAKDLLSPGLVTLDVNGEPLRLIDFSLSGIAAVDGPAGDWSDRVGETVEIRIGIGQETAHQGRARVARVESTAMGQKLGVQFVEGYLDVSQLMARHEEALLRQELNGGLQAEIDGVCPGYRQLCADVVYFLRRYKAALGRVAETEEPAAGTRRNRHRLDEILDHCEETAIPDWRRLWQRGNELVASVMDDPEKLRAVKRFTELVVTPEFMAAPIWQRGYEKPLGYPGDFQLMKQVYDWERIGDTAYGRLVHRLGLEVAECIATRMVSIKQTIADTVATAEGNGRVNILSLGCGPAQEVANYLRVPRLERPVAFTLVDQDQSALSLAYEQTLPEVMRHGGLAAVSCLHVSFTQLLKAWSIVGELPTQDLIYSVGLIDYLALRRARPLIATLYGQLKPGGRLVIGNMRDTPMSNIWPMEFICDWSVIYRDEAGMRALAEGLSPAPEIEAVRPDRTGRVYLLYLRRPA